MLGYIMHVSLWERPTGVAYTNVATKAKLFCFWWSMAALFCLLGWRGRNRDYSCIPIIFYISCSCPNTESKRCINFPRFFQHLIISFKPDLLEETPVVPSNRMIDFLALLHSSLSWHCGESYGPVGPVVRPSFTTLSCSRPYRHSECGIRWRKGMFDCSGKHLAPTAPSSYEWIECNIGFLSKLEVYLVSG